MPASLRSLVASWAELWETPGLEDAVAVTFSHRLRRSLGRCRPAAGRVTLSADLRDGPAERLAEVLCHEVAHVAVYHKYGRAARPHGPEWRRLVAATGHEPRVREVASELGSGMPTASPHPPARLAYEHRCPVCQTVRFARRPVSRWRCAECLDAGLDGVMVITRRSET